MPIFKNNNKKIKKMNKKLIKKRKILFYFNK